MIISALVFPRFTGVLSRLQVEGDARQLAYTLRCARQEAVTSGSYKAVVFYFDDNTYRYNNQFYSFNRGTTYVVTNFNSFYGGRNACIFLPDGTSSAAGRVTIKCQNIYKSVIVLNTTGRIRVED
ncbi:GspH/FimT family pseudopilin [Syntrophomonas zehnderi]|uniref:GspH/FimT family pseudopilin n=1 Tax=Syntrophomonas zehnderi TaxID=404335 RepID=UPI000697B7AD|nr:GspH/FimT family pseudopilin [Syntrophomonas zehnderi]